jgi:hypothetical protein
MILSIEECGFLVNAQRLSERTVHLNYTYYPDRLGLSVKCVVNSTKLTCLEITGYRIQYSTVLWFLDLQIRRGQTFKRRYIL